MKTIAITSVIILMALQNFAQFKLSGSIKDYKKGADSLTINIPFIYGFYHENDMRIPVDYKGRFNFVIPIHSQVFINLAYKNGNATLLVTPGKTLSVLIDSSGNAMTFNGTAGRENRLIHDIKLNEFPFFLQGDNSGNPYAKLSAAELQQKLVKPWFKLQEANTQMVMTANISTHDKALIAAEIKYQFFTQLNNFAYGVIYADKKLVSEFLTTNYAGLKTDPDVLPAGPNYYYFAQGYISYLNSKIFAQYGPADERTREPFVNIYHISIDSAMSLAKQYGNSYIKWYLFKQYFNKQVAERYLAQSIWSECRNKDISQIKPLMIEFKANFPNSVYTSILQQKVNEIELFNKQNVGLKNIDVFAGYNKLSSIYEVVNAFKGKVIYLDVWGTWCGPCKRELLYNPQLKAHFKNKDVVFVYLDADDDDKDAYWKKFIHLNGITGIHLRKSKAEMNKIWDELLPENKERFYPYYFIFNKDGKLAKANAKQPSDGPELYTELEKYL
jgi:thiol-disulfide isomerase/thioredoxin